MKKYLAVVAAVLISIVVCLSGCMPVTPVQEAVKAGQLEGHTYQNTQLGIQYTIPENWDVIGSEDTKTLQLESQKQAGTYTKSFENTIDEGQMGYLFYAESVGESGNANILAQVFLKDQIQGENSKDYVQQLLQEFKQAYHQVGGQMETQEPETIEIDGHPVAQAKASVLLDGEIYHKTFDNTQLFQIFSVYTIDQVSVVVMVSAYDEEQLAQGQEMLDSLSFD